MRLDRKTKVKLLLGSYEDALLETRLEGHSGKPDSRALRHNEELWNAGSYAELSHWLERLKERAHSIHWHTIELYIRKDPNSTARKRKADLGLTFLAAKMPRDIYVPVEITENAGFNLSEAKEAARPRLRRAA